MFDPLYYAAIAQLEIQIKLGRISEGIREYVSERKQERFGDSLSKGDVIFINRGLYSHFGIYVSDNEVIHFADPNSNSLDPQKAVVHSVPLKKFLDGSKRLYFCKFREFYSKPLIYFSDYIDYAKSRWGSLYMLQNWGNIYIPIPSSNKKFALRSGEETVANAYSMLGSDRYNLINNNCEHFAFYCKTGINESHQVKNFVKFICGVFGTTILFGGILSGLFMHDDV